MSAVADEEARDLVMGKTRNRVAMVALATGAAVLLVGCGGSDGGGSRSDAATDR